MSNTNIIMPQMGESITEATITRWRKQVGEEVRDGEVLLDISTAKVEVEIPAPAHGVVAEIRFPEGATVPIDTLICVLAPKGTVVTAANGAASEAAPSAAKEKSAASGATCPLTSATAVAAPPAAATPTIGANGGSKAASGAPIDKESKRVELIQTRSTPLVRNMAREFGVDIADVPGSGSHGRVTKRDLEAFMSEPRAKSSPKPRTVDPIAPASSHLVIRGEHELVPMSAIRKQIAEHMVRSRKTSPHAYTVFDVDFTRLERLRHGHRADFERHHGAKLTPLVFVLKALATLIPRHPILNSSMKDENTIVLHRAVNLAVAVSIPQGLIVPVIHDSSTLSMAGIARTLSEKASRARANKLVPSDIEGGTFTITSPGQLGAVMGTPIINQPQAAILHLGAVSKMPTVVSGPDGEDVIAVRQRAHLTLGFDHRIIDGWEADSFMAELKTMLEKADFAREL